MDGSYKLIQHNNPDRLEVQNKIDKRLVSPKHGLSQELLFCDSLSCEADKVVEKIKELKSEIPVIILSARSLKEDKIKGFRIGVDDYITKPFDEEELLYRIRAIINRIKNFPEMTNGNKPVWIGKFEFDSKNQLLIFGNKELRLTIKENKILSLLSNSINNLVRREEIMIDAWGESDYYTGRSLDVFISKLRSYLKNDPGISITTIPTVGYILEIKEGPLSRRCGTSP